MSTVLETIFGSELINKFFTLEKEGVTMSRAQGLKNDNTNKARALLAKFGNYNIYSDILTAIASTGTTTKEVNPQKLTPKDFDDLQIVANLFAENAILGHGINLRNRMEIKINSMDDNEWIGLFNIPFPEHNFKIPQKRAVSTMNLDRLLALDRVEEIIENVSGEVLSSFSSKDIMEALGKESRLAVLGNQLTQKQCFLINLLDAVKSLPVEENTTGFALILREKVRAYTDEEVEIFSLLQQGLYSEYSSLQMELNGFKKLLKDKIREIQLGYDNEYSLAMKNNKEEQNKFSAALMETSANVGELKTLAMKELASLKIRVP